MLAPNATINCTSFWFTCDKVWTVRVAIQLGFALILERLVRSTLVTRVQIAKHGIQNLRFAMLELKVLLSAS